MAYLLELTRSGIFKTDFDLDCYYTSNHENVFTGFYWFTVSLSKYAITMKVGLVTPDLRQWGFLLA